MATKEKQPYLQHPMSLTYNDSILTFTAFTIGMQREIPNKVVIDDFQLRVYIVIMLLSTYQVKQVNS